MGGDTANTTVIIFRTLYTFRGRWPLRKESSYDIRELGYHDQAY